MSESEDGTVLTRILKVIQDIDSNDLDMVENWFSSGAHKRDIQKAQIMANSERNLVKIGFFLKKIVPFEAVMPSENINMPDYGDQSDCANETTCHIDEFLYDDKDVEELVKKGKLHRHYCADCNSRNIKDLTFISHSLSRNALLYIFKVLLPEDLDEKQILDIGSRLGGVLYGAYHLSNAGTIVGVEMNEEFYEIQEKVISQFSLDNNRIKVVHSDIMDCANIIQKSDIIILNVLDFFADIEKQRAIWHFFKKAFKKGSYVVTNRSVVDTLTCLDLVDSLSDWLCICRPFQLENEVLFDLDEHNYSELYLYTVK